MTEQHPTPQESPIDGFMLTATTADVTDPVSLARQPGLRWIAAPVPGGVYESLQAAGLIGHPYYGGNIDAVRWVEDCTWWYRTTFDAQPPGTRQRATLILHGVDTVATIWLNGRRLGQHVSQFRAAVFDVTAFIAGRNELVIRFDPPLTGLRLPADLAASAAHRHQVMAAALGVPDSPDGPAAEPRDTDLAVLRRKAILSWGWDFAPRLPSVGLYRPVELRVQDRVTVTEHHLHTTALSAEAGTADLEVLLAVDTFGDEDTLTARLTLTAPDGRTEERDITLLGDGWRRTARITVALSDVQPWWTHDLGTPARYGARLTVYDGRGTALTTVGERIGIRTVTVDQAEDTEEGGRFFRFVLNGVPLFARGANWVPPDLRPGSVTPDRCRHLVGRARTAGMNMLRVWGGGLYEQDDFYDACDAAGILVWQDFMFASAEYPSADPDLRAEVAAEAIYQVRRLRNHPSLALFAGENEVQAVHQAIYGDVAEGNWGYSFFHEVLPAAVAENCPGITYWPGSPWSTVDPKVNGVLDGDRHAWEVWHGVDVGAGGPSEFPDRGTAMHFGRYRHDRGKFISEFGIQSTPDLSTLRRWLTPGAVRLGGAEMARRDTDGPAGKALALLAVETGSPTDAAELVSYMMITQAEGLKFGIEHYRRRQPHCSGTLVWQLNDSWPGFSWSLIDYDGIAKPAYHYVTRAYRPVLTSFDLTGDRLRLWVTNSATVPVTMHLEAGVSSYAGERVIGESFCNTIEPGWSGAVWTATVPARRRDGGHHAWVRDRSHHSAGNRLFFGPVQDQRFGAATLDFVVRDRGDRTAQITVSGCGYNYLVHVVAPGPGVEFDVNYFDLADGESAVIEASALPAGFDAATLQVRSFNAAHTRSRYVPARSPHTDR